MHYVVVTLVIVLASFGPARAQVDLNPPYGDPSYNAYTVFSPDAPAPEAVGQDVVVVFHGFNSAVPNGAYKRIRKAFRETHTVIGVNYDPFDIERSLAFFDDVAEKWLNGRRTVVFGTSFGAFWANRFGYRIGAQKIVLINPVMVPEQQMMKYAGKQVANKRRSLSFVAEAAKLERYASLTAKEDNGIARLVVLAADDERLDFRKALTAYAGQDKTTLIVYPEGGHTLDLRRHPARAAIAGFVNGP